MKRAETGLITAPVTARPDQPLRQALALMREHDISGVPVTDENKQIYMAENESYGAKGLRVMATAQKDFDPHTFNADGDLLEAISSDLQLLALVGIVDPPWPEARDAIAKAHEAGIQVRMITGDHAVTAGAIATEGAMIGPLRGIDIDRVQVPHDEQRTLRAIALQPRNQVRTPRLEGEEMPVTVPTRPFARSRRPSGTRRVTQVERAMLRICPATEPSSVARTMTQNHGLSILKRSSASTETNTAVATENAASDAVVASRIATILRCRSPCLAYSSLSRPVIVRSDEPAIQC